MGDLPLAQPEITTHCVDTKSAKMLALGVLEALLLLFFPHNQNGRDAQTTR